MENIFFWILFLVILFGVFVTYRYSHPRKKLSGARIAFYEGEIRKCNHLSAREKIFQYDKILNHILSDVGYSGTVGEQLKQKPAIIRDLNVIWELHKLRNRLAHDLDHISNDILEKQSRAFERELRAFF